MTILVEIQCDLQDPRARGRNPCASRDNKNPTGTGRTADEAYRKARSAAGHAGWRRRVFRHLGMRMGHVCANCQALADADKAAGNG